MMHTLTKFGTRYYDPSVGRWTQLDPSGIDQHYVYASNDPVNRVDPSGYSDCRDDFWSIGGAVDCLANPTSFFSGVSLDCALSLVGTASGFVATMASLASMPLTGGGSAPLFYVAVTGYGASLVSTARTC